ncbi:MAG TPA: prepilin-type N-terminal cleavage/methylation domain-containing protein, partial [Firmicutes bacterium]|nr:prepilin-type N-terminal cleavage/methylation domain-containing protein [Bacillota bacterium]
MTRHGPEERGHARGGFTLLELLAATAMFAVIIVALYSVFYGALRLRERAAETFETQLPKGFSLSVLKRDLADAVAPTGVLAGPFIGEKIEEGRRRLDRLEIHTASGRVDEH